MIDVFVFTPTRLLGGLDVTFATLRRQTIASRVVWIVGDEHLRKRTDVYKRMADASSMPIVHFDTSTARQDDDAKTLCKAYNYATEIALRFGEGQGIFVSLQDYITIPRDGLERYWRFHEERPRDLCSGLCSIAISPSAFADLEGGFSIFAQPHDGVSPREIGWEDVRGTEIYAGEADDVVKGDPLHWEANWGMYPLALAAEGLRWDESFDKAIAYENQDLAISALVDYGAKTYIDLRNHAVSLPHKRYFPEVEQREMPLTEANRQRLDDKWEARIAALKAAV